MRELLDAAIEDERQALFPDPDDSARMAEAELDTLPNDTARAVRQLADYQWRSPQAREKYEQIQELLRSEVLDAQFAGMRDALQNATPEDLARIREMMAALNEMLDADARGEHTQEQFDEFMQQYGDFFPEQPKDLAELIDSLARRAAAAQRLMDSLTPEQQSELGDLMAQALGNPGWPTRWPGCSRACGRRVLTCVGRPRAHGRRPAASATPTPPVRSPNSLTSTNSRSCSARTIPAPASTTSTKSSSNARSAAAPWTTWIGCARSSESCAGRATSSAAATA